MVGRMKVILALALALAGALSVTACSRSDAGEPNSHLEIAPVERRTLEIRAEAAGLVEPIRVVEVKSKASGEILRLGVETGDRVERGAFLAEIDPRDVRNAFSQAEADLEVARARLSTSEAQRKRAEELRKANVITEQEFEAAVLDVANARAQLIKAETNLELARERLGDVIIRAPIDGTIIQKDVEVGQIIASASQNISGGTTLFLMADLSEMQVRTLVDETDIGRIAAGLPAQVTVEAFPGRIFAGEVLKIEPQAVVEQNVTMFPVLVRLDNREGLLKPGMNAEVRIEIARRDDAVTVPNAAVVAMRDAMAAGAVLGLSEDAMRSALQRGRRAQASDAGEAEGGDSESAEGNAREGRAGRARPAGGRAGGPGMGGRPGGGPGGGFGPARSGDIRPGVVFVRTASGPEPRPVILGLNDWDYTEVINGLEPGEEVILISVARLQQQQQQFLDRLRERNSGPFPGARGR